MANIKSAKKRIKVIEKKTLVNKMRKSQVKTAMKKFEMLLAENNFDAAKEQLKACQKKIHRVAAKGTLHEKTAARKISRMASKLNKAMNA